MIPNYLISGLSYHSVKFGQEQNNNRTDLDFATNSFHNLVVSLLCVWGTATSTFPISQEPQVTHTTGGHFTGMIDMNVFVRHQKVTYWLKVTSNGHLHIFR